MSRLVIVLLNSGHVFTNMKTIQAELNPIIQRVIPDNCSNLPCPYMTDGDELGERLILKQTNEFIIEEYKADDDNFYRRLVLTKNLNQIQSQFKVTYVPTTVANDTSSLSKSLLPEKKDFCIGIDQSYLDFDCHKLMVVGLALMEQSLIQQGCRTLVLGGGLGALSSFLKQHLENFKIETVEISEEIIKIAEEMFEVKANNDDFRIICADAYEFVNKIAENNEKTEKDQPILIKEEEETKSDQKINNNNYDLIIIDINSDDVNETSPPAKFLSHHFLLNLQKCLSKNGMLFLNFINKDDKTFWKVLKDISEVFHLVYSANVENEYNTVIFAKNLKYQIDTKKDCHNEEEKIIMVEESTIFDKKAIEFNYKNIVKNLKKPWDQTLNLDGFLNSLVLQYPNLNKNPFEKKDAHFLDVKENITNNTKEMYIKDMEKVNKNKKKKKKNKMR